MASLSAFYRTVYEEIANLMTFSPSLVWVILVAYLLQLIGVFSLTEALDSFIGLQVVSHIIEAEYLLCAGVFILLAQILMRSYNRSTRQQFISSVVESAIWTFFISLTLNHFDFVYEFGIDLRLSFILMAGFIFITVFLLRWFAYRMEWEVGLLSFLVVVLYFPFYTIYSIVGGRYRLFVIVSALSLTLLFSMSLIAFEMGDFLILFTPLEGVNVYFITLLFGMIASQRLVSFLSPRTRLSALFGDTERTVTIIMTWGMVLVMSMFYMADLKVLLGPGHAWGNEAKNSILWAFTTYRLVATMLNPKHSVFQMSESVQNN